jgi:hypothetical protein
MNRDVMSLMWVHCTCGTDLFLGILRHRFFSFFRESEVENVADAAEGDAALKACQRLVAVDTNERMRVP